jgi:hypothetical protein
MAVASKQGSRRLVPFLLIVERKGAAGRDNLFAKFAASTIGSHQVLPAKRGANILIRSRYALGRLRLQMGLAVGTARGLAQQPLP